MASPTDFLYRIDKRAVRRAFERAADGYEAAALLQREVAGRLLARLDYIKLEARTVLDAGTGTGYALPGLKRRYPQARLVALDLALNMLRKIETRRGGWRRFLPGRDPLPERVCGDLERLPLAGASVDLVWSNLTLQWCNDPARVFAEVRRVLRPGGLFLFTTFGPDTLKELRQAFAGVDGYVHVSRFIDMHDLGDALVRAGFADPVMDMEFITVAYAEFGQILRDLKAIGAHNATEGRRRGLMGKNQWRQAQARYEALRRDGRLPATFEVVYGHAWQRAPRLSAGERAVIEIRPRRPT
ncbi:MAG: malonyl-[acyl-carrier protein] O-methyltransferase [Burkholderiales bacterium]|nr:MAG: malonyl-[acyl-carrier protein] O-methyltransferase [Burkholderiales bacterium]